MGSFCEILSWDPPKYDKTRLDLDAVILKTSSWTGINAQTLQDSERNHPRKQRTTRIMETARYQRKKHLPINLNEKRNAEIEATMETYKQY